MSGCEKQTAPAGYPDSIGALWWRCVRVRLAPVVSWCVILTAIAAEPNLVPNGGFEEGLAQWRPFWTREENAGTIALDDQIVHSGKASIRIHHRGERDWCLNSTERVAVQPGDLLLLEAWVKSDTPGSPVLCLQAHDAAGQVVDWSLAARAARGGSHWHLVRSRLVIPPKVAAIEPRIIGSQPGTHWIDEVTLRREGTLGSVQAKLPTALALSNAFLRVTVNPTNAAFAARDQRNHRTWRQQPLAHECYLTGAQVADGLSLRLQLRHIPSALDLTAVLQLDPGKPELSVQLEADGELPGPLPFPHPFATESGTYLVVPLNEGIAYPVDDPAIARMRLIAYGGHGICMAFWGVTDGAAGQMAILETADDAAIRIDRLGQRLVIAPEWDPQHGQFGYARRVRYVFFDRGGHVAFAKRYRIHAQETGRFKTLAEKRAANPNVDRLIGAVNVWCWEKEATNLAHELQAAGIQRILWSNRQSPESLRVLNERGVLTSRYDIYQDVMNPDNFRVLRGVHPDWTTDAWPNDIIRGPDGDWLRGWAVKGTNGQWYPCGVICDRRAPAYAARRIPAELATHPYQCRFIDTTTAAPWHECYQADHPMTRTDSREWKMKLLRYVCDDLRLVTGCETGHDAAVPFVHYFEGMLSLGPYRVPDAGRDLQRIWSEVPEPVAKFQVGYAYRLPLWELVYHDCVVAQWYWGDYNNKLPALWDLRDLFNILYGTPPMFMFNRELWRRQTDRFVQSYRNIAPIARASGYSEMVDHRWLTPDRAVQQTVFANGLKVVVNFGSAPWPGNDGRTVPARGFLVSGLND